MAILYVCINMVTQIQQQYHLSICFDSIATIAVIWCKVSIHLNAEYQGMFGTSFNLVAT